MVGMLLCAGLGTRFRPHTDKIAKPALPFLNIPLLSFGLYYLEQLGLERLVVNTHHLPHTVELALAPLAEDKDFKTFFSREEPHILGSGGGIRHAERLLAVKDDFVVYNGDEIILFSHAHGLKPLYDFHKKSGALATLLTTNHPEAGKSFGGVWDNNGAITRLGDKSNDPGAKHFTGVFVFSPRIFQFMPSQGEFHIFKNCLIPAMAKGEKVLAFHDSELLWLDTSSEKDYVKSTRTALENLRDETVHGKNLEIILQLSGQPFSRVGKNMFVGPGGQIAGTIDNDTLVMVGRNAQVGTDVFISGFAVMGAKSRIKNGVVRNSAVAAQVHLNELVSLKNQLII